MHKKTLSRAIPVVVALGMLAAVFTSVQVEAAKENFDRSKPHLSIGVRTTGVDLAGFQQMSGLGTETEVIEYQNGDDPLTRKRPGRTKYSNITLKRGYTGATDTRDWAEEALGGSVERRDVSIVMLDRAATVVHSFMLFECFPTRWQLVTNDEGFLIEELTLAVERVQMTE